jgi:putative transposase
MPIKISFKLTTKKVGFLRTYTRGKKLSARQLTRARTLLLLHEGKTETDIAEYLGINFTTVWRIKKRCLAKGVAEALKEDPRPGQPKDYTKKYEGTLIALACSGHPAGRQRWTLSLLRERLHTESKKSMNRESIRLMLKKGAVSLG